MPAPPSPAPGAPATASPRVTVLLLAYQQARYVPAAASAVLSQAGGPYEILFSDDASTDGTYEALCAAAVGYRGPHTVRVRRNPRNLGIGAHYNALVEAASGDLLVTAAADDLSLPGRIERLAALWTAHGGRPDLVASHLVDMDEGGRLHDPVRVDDLAAWRSPQDWIARRPFIVGAGHAFTRRLFERFGPLHDGLAYEDQILTFRAIASGGAITVDEALVAWRRGGTSGGAAYDDADRWRAWLERRLRRQRIEHANLLADAQVAGCAAAVADALAGDIRRTAWQLDVLAAGDGAARWRRLRDAPDLPLGWRLRKTAQAQWPALTTGVKRLSAALHRR